MRKGVIFSWPSHMYEIFCTLLLNTSLAFVSPQDLCIFFVDPMFTDTFVCTWAASFEVLDVFSSNEEAGGSEGSIGLYGNVLVSHKVSRMLILICGVLRQAQFFVIFRFELVVKIIFFPRTPLGKLALISVSPRKPPRKFASPLLIWVCMTPSAASITPLMG